MHDNQRGRKGTRYAPKSPNSAGTYKQNNSKKKGVSAWFKGLSKRGKIITAVIGILFIGFIYNTIASPSTDNSNASLRSTQLLQTSSNLGAQDQVSATTIPAGAKLRVHYIDVGQGDSAFIELPDGKTMLIDAGPNSAAAKVTGYISALGYKKIDYLLASHPHEDHIGGMSEVIARFEIGEIWAVRAQQNTQTFEDFLDAVAAKNMTINTAEAGKHIGYSTGYRIDILYPTDMTSTSELNDWSATCLLKYGDNTFLFPGDAAATIVAKAYSEDIDVLKVAHHGSDTGTNSNLITNLKPEYAVISCGADNGYGHPSEATLAALSGTTVYRTDLQATIVAESDGHNIGFTAEKQLAPTNGAGPDATDGNGSSADDNAIVVDQSPGDGGGSSTSENVGIVSAPVDTGASAETVYITDTGKKYHRDGCSYLAKSKHPINLQDAINRGYGPCSRCF